MCVYFTIGKIANDLNFPIVQIHWIKSNNVSHKLLFWYVISTFLQAYELSLSPVSSSAVAATAQPTGPRASGFAPGRETAEWCPTAAVRPPLSCAAAGTTHPTSTRWRWEDEGAPGGSVSISVMSLRISAERLLRGVQRAAREELSHVNCLHNICLQRNSSDTPTSTDAT